MAPEFAPDHHCHRCSFVDQLVGAARKAVSALTLQSKLKRANAVHELSEALREFDEGVRNYDLVSSTDNKQQYETSPPN